MILALLCCFMKNSTARGLFIKNKLGKKPGKLVNKRHVRYLKVDNVCQIFRMCATYLESGRTCAVILKLGKVIFNRSGEYIFARGGMYRWQVR